MDKSDNEVKEMVSESSLNPLVSIICITYNHKDYISDCINGFLMQKCDFTYEVLVHDDASTDGTLDILHNYKNNFPDLIRLYEEANNQYLKLDVIKMLLNESKGDFVAICEGDDYWIDPFKLQRQIDLFRKYPDMVYCFTDRIVSNELEEYKKTTKYKNKRYGVMDFLAGFNPGLQSICFRRESVSNADLDFGWANHIHGDRIIPISSINNGYALCVPTVTSVYRVTGKGVSTSISKNKSAQDWFDYATSDWYHLHEVLNFPSLTAYIKSVTPYTFNLIKKTGHLIHGLTSVSRYGTSSKILILLKILMSLIEYLLGRILNGFYTILKFFLRKLNTWFVTNQFSSHLFVANGNIFELNKMLCLRSFYTPIINIGNRKVTIADPFLYSDESELRLYYELQNQYRSKGVLMVVTTKDGRIWSKPRVALEEGFHLSFPNVFKMDGEVWMMPETFMANQVRLYQENESTGTFILDSILLEGSKFVDSFLFKKDDIYYLFTSIQYQDNSYDLKLYYSNNLKGGYEEHPMSPLSHGRSYQRNAGCMISYNGKLYRPAQECSAYYGQNVHMMEVVELNKGCYHEVPSVLDIIPNKGLGLGGHQFSTCNFKGKKYVAIDTLHKAINTHVIWNRIIKKIK